MFSFSTSKRFEFLTRFWGKPLYSTLTGLPGKLRLIFSQIRQLRQKIAHQVN